MLKIKRIIIVKKGTAVLTDIYTHLIGLKCFFHFVASL